MGWLCLGNQSNAKIVTLIVHSESQTAGIDVAANEIAELVGFSGAANNNPFDLSCTKQGVSIPLYVTAPNSGSYSSIAAQHIITGPARIQLRFLGSLPSYCTWKIEPESFPPDKAVIIPEGTGARIALECSTNLTQWTEVYFETHTNSPSNKFFRIKAERIP